MPPNNFNNDEVTYLNDDVTYLELGPVAKAIAMHQSPTICCNATCTNFSHNFHNIDLETGLCNDYS